MATKRVSRGRPLAQETAAEYRQLRVQVAEELPDLIARHEQRTGHPDVGNEPPPPPTAGPARDADTDASRPSM
jgi:hypothetical protein